MKGFYFNGIIAGIKNDAKKDLGIIVSDVVASGAAVFTQNLVKAAPVILGQEKMKKGICQAIVVNSGNANCFTGKQGIADAIKTAETAGTLLGISPELVQVSSTGVIGAFLPMDRIQASLPSLVNTMKKGTVEDFAQSILTTDTCTKICSTRVDHNGQGYTITGIAKGSGMIRPNMATMLGFVCTDAGISKETLQTCLGHACGRSFNRISVDGDTSTNDTVYCLANGRSGFEINTRSLVDEFQTALDAVCTDLSKLIVKDGEGATKLIQIRVEGAQSDEAAFKIAEAVSHSNLVKTAIYGQDPNWGRIMAAAGRAGVPVIPDQMDLYFGPVALVLKGEWQGKQMEHQAAQLMTEDELVITLHLNMGTRSDFFYFCDFSENYVKINADYRS